MEVEYNYYGRENVFGSGLHVRPCTFHKVIIHIINPLVPEFYFSLIFGI